MAPPWEAASACSRPSYLHPVEFARPCATRRFHRLGLVWPEFPVPASPASSARRHPWRRRRLCLPRQPTAPVTPAPSDLFCTVRITYPFGFKWLVHHGPVDVVHGASAARPPPHGEPHHLRSDTCRPVSRHVSRSSSLKTRS